jgi:hypothetical protein
MRATVPFVTPHRVGNTGLRALRAAIAEPERFAWDARSTFDC